MWLNHCIIFSVLDTQNLPPTYISFIFALYFLLSSHLTLLFITSPLTHCFFCLLSMRIYTVCNVYDSFHLGTTPYLYHNKSKLYTPESCDMSILAFTRLMV